MYNARDICGCTRGLRNKENKNSKQTSAVFSRYCLFKIRIVTVMVDRIQVTVYTVNDGTNA